VIISDVFHFVNTCNLGKSYQQYVFAVCNFQS